MTLNFKVYPKKGLVLEGTLKQIEALVSQGIIEETADNHAQFTQSFKISVAKTSDEELMTFITEQWQPLFPNTKVQANSIAPYYVSGNTAHCFRALKEFIKTHKGKYSHDCIFIATAAYLGEKAPANYKGTSKNFNFVKRELENWCDEYLQNPSNLFAKAKAYHEYLRRTVRSGKRVRLISGEGFGISAILGEGDATDRGCTESAGDGGRGGRSDSGSDDGQSGYLQSGQSIKLRPSATRVNKTHKG